MTKFGDRLRTIRKIKDLKQDDVGEIVGMSGSAVGAWERSLREPDLATLGKLAESFDVSADYLLGLSEEPKRGTSRPEVTDLRQFLAQQEVGFNGLQLTDRDKENILNICRGLFYEVLRDPTRD